MTQKTIRFMDERKTRELGKIIHAQDWWTRALPKDMNLDGEPLLGRGQFKQFTSTARRQDQEPTYLSCFYAPDDVAANGASKGRKDTKPVFKTSRCCEFQNLHSGWDKSYAKVQLYENC